MSITSSTRLPDIPSLTGIRFWAAFCILLNHLLLGLVPRDNIWLSNLLTSCGTLGMNLFFVLSGFIIHYNYHQSVARFSRRSVYEFFVARIARLYPLFLVLFVVEFFTTNAILRRIPTSDVVYSLPFFLTLSQSWIYQQISTGAALYYMYPRSSIAWSISTEMLMYFFYPAILYVLIKDRFLLKVKCVLTVAAVIGGTALIYIVQSNVGAIDKWAVEMFGTRVGIAQNHSFSFAHWLTFISPYIRLVEFAMGACVAHLYVSSVTKPAGQTESWIGLWLGGVACVYILLTFLPAPLMLPWIKGVKMVVGYPPVVAILLFVCARYGNAAITRFFSLKPFVFLGERSYSIYLFHIFLASLLVAVPAAAGFQWVRFLVYLISVFVCAHILYTYVELPGKIYLRTKLLKIGPQ